MSRIFSLDADNFLSVAKALSNELRLNIYKELLQGTLSVQRIAEIFGLPPSTALVNINKLEEAKLIQTELVSGTRGSQKMCSALYDRLVADFIVNKSENATNPIYVSIPIGNYVNCEVSATCGITTENGVIGFLDDPRSFYEPESNKAQLLWFRKGFVEYWVPNKIPYDSFVESMEISMEICSEAPLYNSDWPSDITMWINDIELGTWMSPGDFGGKRGLLTPDWWDIDSTQFGLLKKWSVNASGSFVDGMQVSSHTIEDFGIATKNYFKIKIGVKDDAINKRGLNIFGRKFGNYPQDIVVRMDPSKKQM